MVEIICHASTKTFHLCNDRVSYLLSILDNGQPGHLYFGKKLHDREDFSHLQRTKTAGHTTYVKEGDYLLSLDIVRQEYPSYGTTDYREPAYVILQEDGSRITDFRYTGYEITEGKRAPEGLPGTWTGEENGGDQKAKTLCLHLTDEKLSAGIDLYYTVFEDVDVIARHTAFANRGEGKLVLESAMSLSLDMPDDKYELLHLNGAWAREMHPQKRTLAHGLQGISSTRGSSSAEANPFLALVRDNTSEDLGEAYGFLLLYSGNFLAEAEVGRFRTTRIRMGIHPLTFTWVLESGASFVTPEALVAYSDAGLGMLSRTLHDTLNHYLVRGTWRGKNRPVLLNSWESVYFDITEEKLFSMAEKAAASGVELFVVDDGWFGHRNDDTSSLGDWFANRDKFPEGIGAFSKKIHALGLQFGLWFEPEMCNRDSELFRAHPDWVVGVPGRPMSVGRNQYVLDFSNPAVVDHIYRQMETLLSESAVDYIKWDMNRPVTEPWSHALAADRQGEFFHRYILGVYDLYERLTTRFPGILFESCASGGARFDAGMLYYAPQAWTSDDTDAVERMKIQYGASIAYPLSSMGAHVSAAVNHQTGRCVSLDTRANIAFFGVFGYELDITLLSETEQEEIAAQVRFWKEYRELLTYGDLYRLQSPFTHNYMAWMVVSKDRAKAILGIYKRLAEPNPAEFCVRLKGLREDALYQIKGGVEGCYYGDELMYAGFYPLQGFAGTRPCNANAESVHSGEDMGDFTSQLYIIEEKA